jgi:2-keto-4-pentenoate hydratase/2-oxohepta-3-ene-1,7-dioic acid hydratase in catechol pathway
MVVPAQPVLFMKATSAICWPNDDVTIPRGSLKTDCGVELVIGRVCPPTEHRRDHELGSGINCWRMLCFLPPL